MKIHPNKKYILDDGFTYECIGMTSSYSRGQKMAVFVDRSRWVRRRLRVAEAELFVKELKKEKGK